jgi:hypothetical protein
MSHFWNDVVAPVVEAAGARPIGEVGTLRVEIGEVMLGWLAPDVELHGEFAAVSTSERRVLIFDQRGIVRCVS